MVNAKYVQKNKQRTLTQSVWAQVWDFLKFKFWVFAIFSCLRSWSLKKSYLFSVSISVTTFFSNFTFTSHLLPFYELTIKLEFEFMCCWLRMASKAWLWYFLQDAKKYINPNVVFYNNIHVPTVTMTNSKSKVKKNFNMFFLFSSLVLFFIIIL